MVTAALIVGLLGWSLILLSAVINIGSDKPSEQNIGCGVLPVSMMAVAVIVAAFFV